MKKNKKKSKQLQEEEKLKQLNEDGVEILQKKTVKDLISPSGIDASNIDHMEIISNAKRFARSFFFL